MRTSAIGLVVVGAALSLALSGCSSDDTNDNSAPAGDNTNSSAGTTPSSSASAGTSPSASGSSSGAAGATVDGKGAKVGIILPDTQSSNRWVAADPEALKANCERVNLECDIQNAGGSAAKQKTIAQQMAAGGVKVLMLVNLDAASGATILQEAKQNGVITIDYDRLTPGGGAALYVSFDNTKVGELQGKALTECPQVKGKPAVKYVDIDGAPTDNNATLFAQGYDSVLGKTPGWTRVGKQTGNWDATTAGRVFNSFIQKNPDLGAVMVANDTMAGAVITNLTNLRLNGKVAVSGQDASPAGLQQILAGNQCFTIYKPSTGEAGPAVEAAAKLANGEIPQTTQTIKDPKTGQDVPAILAEPVVITKENVALPINDGYTAKDQVCTGRYAALCTAAGVK
ncbi:MAG TPA: substrate-binding domain-containing protein [Jatrophihabitans sp.]|jgi:D-xylose transport system substrate-binding protein|uniref:sugar ABC transporter substrate-binding protein n=1 Tax=Jatrophihabitans sp. TaxID=1932789 RepID=UPI002F078A72